MEHREEKRSDLVHFFNEDGLGAIVNSSRGIIAAYKQEKYAKFGAEHFAEASRAAVIDMVEDISTALREQSKEKDMSEKSREEAIVIRQEEIADGVFSMWLKTDEIAKNAKAGQFISVYCKDGSRMLPRPISICEIDKKDGALRIVYRVVGKGTEEFSGMRAGMILDILGPLGNGFRKNPKKSNPDRRRDRNSANVRISQRTRM